jgi:hypothetical protein
VEFTRDGAFFGDTRGKVKYCHCLRLLIRSGPELFENDEAISHLFALFAHLLPLSGMAADALSLAFCSHSTFD